MNLEKMSMEEIKQAETRIKMVAGKFSNMIKID